MAARHELQPLFVQPVRPRQKTGGVLMAMVQLGG
jgi:hypothetical protein